MALTSEDVVAKEVSKSLLGIEGEATGQKLLDAISSFCEANDIMLYGLMGAGIIKETAARKKIADYRFLVNKEKARDTTLIKNLLYGSRERESKKADFSLVASYPKEEEFKSVKGLESLYAMLCRLIISADKQIAMANPFFDKEGIEKMVPYLKQATERGVKAKIVSRPAYDASKEHAEQLRDLISELGENCEARQFAGSKKGKPFHLHAKFMVADNKKAYVGSANITETSLGNNVEVGVIFTGKKAEALLGFFNLVWRNSSEGW